MVVIIQMEIQSLEEMVTLALLAAILKVEF